MRWNSFRVRLSLWNVAVLAVTLTAFGALLGYLLQRTIGFTVDRELAIRARRFSRVAFGPPPTPDRPFGGPEGPPILGQPGEGPARGGFAPPRPRPEQQTRARYEDPEAERAAAFVRPHLHLLDGSLRALGDDDRTWDPEGVRRALEGEEHYATVSIDGEDVRVLSIPVYWNGQIEGAAQAAQPLTSYDNLRTRQTWALVLLTPAVLLAAGLGGLFLTSRSVRPIQEITETAAEIGAHDLSQRLKVTGDDELADLARTFNGMIARLETAFEQQRRFTADASHELRTPLARLKLTTSEALDGEHTLQEYIKALRIADQSADSMSGLVQELLILARMDAGQLPIRRETFELAPFLQDAAADWEDAGPRLELELPPAPLPVTVDPNHLRRVVTNLLENAVRHTPETGSIGVSATRVNGHVKIQVRDTGEGIPPEHLPHIGERFYRADASRARTNGHARGGSGLGLAISRSLMEAHGGTLKIESQVGRGTCVTLTLPVTS